MVDETGQHVSGLAFSFGGKNVLITGHTGFKGAWLSLWLDMLGAKVSGIGFDPGCKDGLFSRIGSSRFAHDFREDIRGGATVRECVLTAEPDYVFHLAAQPLVRRSYREPIETLDTNVIGSANILEAVRVLPKRAHVIFVTSDKCYLNREWHYSYREDDRLGGHDVYSMSKAAAELVAESWRRSFFTPDLTKGRIVSVRAGNVIGGGDYSEDRLIPDCVRALAENRPVSIRNPRATRPWQHVLDCIHGYLTVAAQLDSVGVDDREFDAFNFGPAPSGSLPVDQVVRKFFSSWPDAPSIEILGDTEQLHEAKFLSVSSEKALRLLSWNPVWGVAEAIDRTAEWYRADVAGKTDMEQFSVAQIQSFERDATAI